MPARSVILTGVNHLDQMGQRFTNEKLKDFVQRLPNDVLVINSMFTNNTTKNHEIYTAIHRYKPKHIIMTMWSEPHWYSDHLHIIEKIIEPTGIPYTLFGQYATTDSTVFFDFWILVFNNFCTRYDNKELLPSSPNKLFLNYDKLKFTIPGIAEVVDRIVDEAYVILIDKDNPIENYFLIDITKSIVPFYIDDVNTSRTRYRDTRRGKDYLIHIPFEEVKFND